jgi:hypothetical protein
MSLLVRVQRSDRWGVSNIRLATSCIGAQMYSRVGASTHVAELVIV